MIPQFSLFRYSLLLVLGLMFFSLVGATLYYRTTVANLVAYQYWRLFSTAQSTFGYIDNVGAAIYYEVHGEGRPVVLLHGGLTSIDAFFGQLPTLARSFQVIAIDLRGQGRSSMANQEFSYSLMASDVLAVLDHLQLDKVDLIGWSDGGIVGLRIGLIEPMRIDRLLVIGSNFKPEGIAIQVRESLRSGDPAQVSLWTRIVHRLRSPEPERWAELWGKVRTLWLTRPDITVADLVDIRAKVLVVMGEFDTVELGHAREMTAAINDAVLVIIPDAGHQLLVDKPQEILGLMLSFLQEA